MEPSGRSGWQPVATGGRHELDGQQRSKHSLLSGKKHRHQYRIRHHWRRAASVSPKTLRHESRRLRGLDSSLGQNWVRSQPTGRPVCHPLEPSLDLTLTVFPSSETSMT